MLENLFRLSQMEMLSPEENKIRARWVKSLILTFVYGICIFFINSCTPKTYMHLDESQVKNVQIITLIYDIAYYALIFNSAYKKHRTWLLTLTLVFSGLDLFFTFFQGADINTTSLFTITTSIFDYALMFYWAYVCLQLRRINIKIQRIMDNNQVVEQIKA